jgi:phosphoglycerate dehydrogenase-like enzyme
VLTPHIGASTHDSQRRIGELIVGAIESFGGDEAEGLGEGFPGADAARRRCGMA